MNIQYVLGTYPTLLEDMVAKVYEAQSPLAEVDSQVLPEINGSGVPTPGAGHQASRTINFSGLDNIPHILRLFTDSGTMLQEFVVNPSEDVVTLYDHVEFTIGDADPGTPLAGTTLYSNPALLDLQNETAIIFREGVMFYGWAGEPAGGFSLTEVGDVFQNGERWYVYRKPAAVTTYVNDSVVAKIVGGFVDVAGTSRDWVAGDLRKLIRLSGNNGKYYFRTGAAVPVGYSHRFSNQVGGTATVYFENGSLITPTGSATQYSLASGASVEFTWDGTNWNKVAESAQATVANIIAAAGSVVLDDVASSEARVVTIGSNLGTTDYKVLGSMRSLIPGSAALDNTVIWAIKDRTSTSFQLQLREITPAPQGLSFDWVIIKTA